MIFTIANFKWKKEEEGEEVCDGVSLGPFCAAFYYHTILSRFQSHIDNPIPRIQIDFTLNANTNSPFARQTFKLGNVNAKHCINNEQYYVMRN